MVSRTEKVVSFYDQPKMKDWWKTNQTHAFHYGFYEKGFRTHADAILHMNDVVWETLQLTETRPCYVLDAGCGVGGTSVYLASKHPLVTFTGISLTSYEIELAKEYAAQRKVPENTRFLVSDFCKTSFPDESFDGVIALESMNYAVDTKKFIEEMYRVLKPGGRLVVFDGFRRQKHLSPLMMKAYNHWLSGRAIDDLVLVDDCTKVMANKNFKEIHAHDISSFTAPSQLRGVVIGLPFFFSILAKSMVSLNRYDRSDDSFYMGVSFCGGLLAICGFVKYYAVSAIK